MGQFRVKNPLPTKISLLLNKHHVGNSPLIYTDPSGLFTLYKGNPIIDSLNPSLQPWLRKIPGIDKLDLDIQIDLGEKYGEQAQQYYADRIARHDENTPLLEKAADWAGGTLSSLWTCETSNDTFDTLTAAWGASKFASQTKISDLQKGAKNLKDELNDFLRSNKNNKTPKSILNCSSSFIAGTEVLTPNGIRNIEDIEVGDWVISDEPETEGGVVAKQVTRTFERTDNNGIFDVEIDGEVISSTGNHEFWIDGKGWIAAKDLEAGDSLLTDDGDFVSVDGIEVREGSFEVYNFEVEDFHTYFVSEDEVLVHNAYCSGVPAPQDLLLNPKVNTKNTNNLTEWRRAIDRADISAERQKFLGEDAVKIDKGVWRSLDGQRQFRVVPADYLGKHKIGDPSSAKYASHVHFEFLQAPTNGGSKYKVTKNVHVPLN